jgi:DNA-binding transcriptional MerR regulator
MRRGELSKRTGVSPRSLRYYEEQGLLTSSRSDAGQRRYSDAAVQRVSLIRQLFDSGMSSRVIATVLPCVDVPGDLSVAEETFTVLMRERDRIDADVAHLVETWNASTCCSRPTAGTGMVRVGQGELPQRPEGGLDGTGRDQTESPVSSSSPRPTD